MLTTLLNETAAADDGFSLVQVLTVFVVFAVVWPLLSRLRRRLSDRRRERWSEQESAARDDSPPTG